MGNANKKFKSHNQKKIAAPTAEKLQSRHCRAYRKISNICKLYKSLISQMITVSTKNQSDQTFCQAHGIRSTELKPETPRSGASKTCTDNNKPNHNMTTNLHLFLFFLILNHKQNTTCSHHGTPHQHKRCREIRFSRRLRHREPIQHANC